MGARQALTVLGIVSKAVRKARSRRSGLHFAEVFQTLFDMDERAGSGQRRLSHLSRVIGSLLPLTVLSACHTWVALDPPYADAIQNQRPGHVRLTVDQRSVIVEQPSVSGDSLTGSDEARRRLVFAFDQVSAIEVRRSDALATTLLVAAGTSTAAMITIAIMFQGQE